MMRRRLIAVMLMLAVILMTAGAHAEGWTCPNCGQAGNTGNFCPNCATAKPSDEWTCPECKQEGNTGNYCTNCGAAKPDWSNIAENDANFYLEQIPGETDRVMVKVARIDGGTYIENKQDPYRWAPWNVIDGDESTCWQFSAKKIKNAWIAMEVNEPEDMDEIWVKNGFWALNDKGKDQYPINARLKKIKVDIVYSDENKKNDTLEFTLADDKTRSDWQRLDIGHREGVQIVWITAVSTYKGSSFPNDVCLSEVMLVKHAPASSAMPPSEQKAATVYESRPDVTGVGLLMKLATRSGPGTQYAEPGTFFGNNWKSQTVLVYKKQYENGVWWVQVDFQNGTKSKYRVWTGAKRVDVDLDKVKLEKPVCQCDIHKTSDTYYGPGGKYAKANRSINREASGTVYQFENGYADVEYWYEDDYDGVQRLWVPQDAVYNLYYGDNSGESDEDIVQQPK